MSRRNLGPSWSYRPCPGCGDSFHFRDDLPVSALCGACDPKGTTMARKPKNGTETKPAAETTADPTHAPVVRHKFIQKLPCRIDEPALVTMAEGMAQLFEDLDAAEEARAEDMRRHKQTITGIKEKMKDLANGVRSHTEMRDVECMERLTSNNEIEVVRVDTGEILETRAADAMDLQDELPLSQPTPNEPEPGDVDEPDAVLAGETQWTTGPNPKPIQPEA